MKDLCQNCKSKDLNKINYYPSKLKSLIKYLIFKLKLNRLLSTTLSSYGNKIDEIEELFIFKKIYLCQYCNLGFVMPQIIQASLNKFYLKKYWNEFRNSEYPVDNDDEKINYLKNYVHNVDLKLILEVGPGSGNFYLKFKKHFINTKQKINYIGVDLSDSSKHIKDSIYIYQKDTSEIINSSIDLIIMIQSIEHFINIKEIENKIFKKLKKGGLIYIETPNYNDYYYKNYQKGWVPHTLFFNIKSLTQLAKNNNFKIINMEAFETPWSEIIEGPFNSIEGHNIRLILEKI